MNGSTDTNTGIILTTGETNSQSSDATENSGSTSGAPSENAGSNTNSSAPAASSSETSASPKSPEPTAAKKSPAKPKAPLPAVASIVTGSVLAATTDKPYVLIKLVGGHIGLLHESRVLGLTREARNKRMAAFKKDEELRLAVLDASDDGSKPRISLSEREAQILDLLAKLTEGTVVTGTVANKQLYGAFIDLGDNVHGLLHIKQMPGDNRTEKEAFLEGLTDGQEVTVKVASVKREDGGKPRIDLELAQ